MSNMSVHFSSKSNDWATPQDFFDKMNVEFNFTLDAAASAENAKCAKFFAESENGLDQDWSGETVWLNPPYGKETPKWIEKAFAESQKGATVVCLIPARTDTRYFHDYCFKGEVRFIKGRLIFGSDSYWAWVWEQEFLNGKPNSLYKKYGKKTSAPFPSVIVIFKGETEDG